MAEQDPSNKFIPDLSGPYQQYLSQTQPQPQQALQQPSGREGKTGQWAYFIDQFIEGAQRGRWQKQQGELMKERQSDQTVQQYLKLLDDKDPVQAQQLRQQMVTEQGKQAMAFMEQSSKGKGKKGEEGPYQHVLGAVKSLGQGLLGGPVKKWEGYGDKLGEWAQQLHAMPSREEAQTRDYDKVWNSAVQQAYSEAKAAHPDREPFENEITGNPAVVKAQQYMQSYYKMDPMKQLQASGAYGTDPDLNKTPEQKAADKAIANYKKADAMSNTELIESTTNESIGDDFVPVAVPYGTDGKGIDTAYLGRLAQLKKALPNLQISVDGKNVTAWLNEVNGKYYDTHGNHITGNIGRWVAQPQERWINLNRPAIGADGKYHPASRNNLSNEIRVDNSVTVQGANTGTSEKQMQGIWRPIQTTYDKALAKAETDFATTSKQLEKDRRAAHEKDLSQSQKEVVEDDFNRAYKQAQTTLNNAKKQAQLSYGRDIDQTNERINHVHTNFAGEYASMWATGNQDEIDIPKPGASEDDEDKPKRAAPPKAEDKPAAQAPAAKQAAPAGGLSMKDLLEKMKKKKPGQ